MHELSYHLHSLLEKWPLFLFSLAILAYFTVATRTLHRLFQSLIGENRDFLKQLSRLAGVYRQEQDSHALIRLLGQKKFRENLCRNLDKLESQLLNSRCYAHIAVSFRRNLWTYLGREDMQFSSAFIDNTFTYEQISRNHIPEKRFDHAQQALISLGVLGTFFGLVIGVSAASSGLASTDADDARQALSALLDGAGLAFITSLLGLSFALWFSHLRSRLESELDFTVGLIRQALNAAFPYEDALLHHGWAITAKMPEALDQLIHLGQQQRQSLNLIQQAMERIQETQDPTPAATTLATGAAFGRRQ